jgi:hypothetical protein
MQYRLSCYYYADNACKSAVIAATFGTYTKTFYYITTNPTGTLRITNLASSWNNVTSFVSAGLGQHHMHIRLHTCCQCICA